MLPSAVSIPSPCRINKVVIYNVGLGMRQQWTKNKNVGDVVQSKQDCEPAAATAAAAAAATGDEPAGNQLARPLSLFHKPSRPHLGIHRIVDDERQHDWQQPHNRLQLFHLSQGHKPAVRSAGCLGADTAFFQPLAARCPAGGRGCKGKGTYVLFQLRAPSKHFVRAGRSAGLTAPA